MHEAATCAYIGIGSNLNDPVKQVKRALIALQKLPTVNLQQQSALYLSKATDYAPQPDFINAVAAVTTKLSAIELLRQLQALECQLGKIPPKVRFGPRTIDLDLLWMDGWQLTSDILTLPHPRMWQRPFVLYPLRAIAPDAKLWHGFDWVRFCQDKPAELITKLN